MTKGFGGDSPINVSRYLKDMHFPAEKQDLVQHARQHQAEPEVLQSLENLPQQEFKNMAEIMEAFGRKNIKER